MIAFDTNILVYAHRRDSEWHLAASRLVREAAEGRTPWALPWPCAHEFLAVVTHPRIYNPASTLAEALAQLDAWLASPSVVTLSESGQYAGALAAVATGARVAGPQVHDARIAALCAEHGVTELWTADRDFSRFKGLKARNPLL